MQNEGEREILLFYFIYFIFKRERDRYSEESYWKEKQYSHFTGGAKIKPSSPFNTYLLVQTMLQQYLPVTAYYYQSQIQANPQTNFKNQKYNN